MSGDQLGNLGAGETVSFQFTPCPVNVGRSPDMRAGVGVTAASASPIGPKVVVAVKGALPGQAIAFCYMAHITAEEATGLAAELLMAASVIAEHEARRS